MKSVLITPNKTKLSYSNIKAGDLFQSRPTRDWICQKINDEIFVKVFPTFDICKVEDQGAWLNELYLSEAVVQISN
jgi:hypothetical protein